VPNRRITTGAKCTQIKSEIKSALDLPVGRQGILIWGFFTNDLYVKIDSTSIRRSKRAQMNIEHIIQKILTAIVLFLTTINFLIAVLIACYFLHLIPPSFNLVLAGGWLIIYLLTLWPVVVFFTALLAHFISETRLFRLNLYLGLTYIVAYLLFVLGSWLYAYLSPPGNYEFKFYPGK
jgi:hypothetical protein